MQAFRLRQAVDCAESSRCSEACMSPCMLSITCVADMFCGVNGLGLQKKILEKAKTMADEQAKEGQGQSGQQQQVRGCLLHACSRCRWCL